MSTSEAQIYTCESGLVHRNGLSFSMPLFDLLMLSVTSQQKQFYVVCVKVHDYRHDGSDYASKKLVKTKVVLRILWTQR